MSGIIKVICQYGEVTYIRGFSASSLTHGCQEDKKIKTEIVTC